jgi:hypothetical protein
MTLRGALDDYKRRQGDPRRFPGERRTTRGRFSGRDGRLVHVAPDGSLRDFGYPLTKRAGVDRSRFGLRLDGEVHWFEAAERRDQRYLDGTTVVRTDLTVADVDVVQHDLTLDAAHRTHVAVRGDLPEDAALVVYAAFAPEGRESRVGRLSHGDCVEVFHDREHDVLAVDGGIEATYPGRPAAFESILGDAPEAVTLGATGGRYEDTALGGEVLLTTSLDAEAGVDDGDGDDTARTTLVSLLTDRTATSRETALERVRSLAGSTHGGGALLTADRERAPVLPATPRSAAVAADVRALSLLAAPSGARIAGPEFDPFYAYTGGYGYTWFRDDAEIARFVLGAARAFDLPLDDWHDRSAAFYAGTQLDDGTWPHRVWPADGALAPGWANARLEGDDGADYQADQTASVVAFLAAYVDDGGRVDDGNGGGGGGGDGDRDDPSATLARGLDGLDATLADDGLPEPCQNAWENATGRFAHTAATFLEAYAAVASIDGDGAHESADPLPDGLRERAADRAEDVLDVIDDLWVPDRGVYARRLVEGDPEADLDVSTLALVEAHRTAADALGPLGDRRLSRLASHVETTLDGLHRDPGPVAGLIRFEGDDWRARDQSDEKIWTVSTAWGANAAAHASTLFADHGRGATADAFESRGRALLDLLLPGGALATDAGYLPEQVFDDGTPDSATPLGWPHALRLATIAHLEG